MTPEGVVRVGGTRVSLETVLWTFLEGATAEEIALRYPALSLSDVYATIAFYLRHRSEVDGYLTTRRTEMERDCAEVAREFPVRTEVRERLLARLERQDRS
ncbi:MAG: DUF433 domain-containing protein [Planctomycetes bacterium]|nr:DUF433 domain-containing protein [Planctomycetota bacterium]